LRGDHRQAIRDQERSRSYRALEEAYRQRETVFAAVMADRTEWEAATRQQRQQRLISSLARRRSRSRSVAGSWTLAFSSGLRYSRSGMLTGLYLPAISR
jgi:hypothetical protein